MRFLYEAAFDPEAIEALSAAFDKAVADLDKNGQPKIVREVIAKRIIALAREGERDADRLCAGALASLGIRN